MCLQHRAYGTHFGQIGEQRVRRDALGRAIPHKRELDIVRSAVLQHLLGQILAQFAKAHNADAMHAFFSHFFVTSKGIVCDFDRVFARATSKININTKQKHRQ